MKPVARIQFNAHFGTPLLGPEGWQQWAIFVQPVKQISGFYAVAQLSQHS